MKTEEKTKRKEKQCDAETAGASASAQKDPVPNWLASKRRRRSVAQRSAEMAASKRAFPYFAGPLH
uniref:Uncharacterized protein n=1 Tax=Romanomermis culicivorax TaxID=13658 RepID=A0A915KSA4_ROMCU